MARKIGITSVGVVGCVLFVWLALTGVALAQTRSGDRFRTGSEVEVGSDELISDDLYAAGSRIVIRGSVAGDLVAVGGEIDITGEVEGDVVAAGGRVSVTGDVGGDVRVAGGEVSLGARVAEDALVAGGRLAVAAPATVEGDLLFSGGEMNVAGRVEGDIRARAGTYDRSGFVGGTERVTTDPPDDAPSASERFLTGLRRYVAVVIVGALLLWMMPAVFERAADRARSRLLPALGLGALTLLGSVLGFVAIGLIAALIALVLALVELEALVAIVVFAALLSAIALAFVLLVALLFGADALVGFACGRAALTSGRTDRRGTGLVALALGAALVVGLTALPVVGGFLKFLISCVGIGALVLALRDRREGEATT